MSVVRFAAPLLVGLALLAGCAKRPTATEAAPTVTILQDVMDLLRTSAATTNRVPAGIADLAPHQATFTRGYNAVKSGDVVVIWGARLQGEGESGKSEAVVAYEKNVPTSGGQVLLSAGTVKHMTAEEFKAAPKAGK